MAHDPIVRPAQSRKPMLGLLVCITCLLIAGGMAFGYENTQEPDKPSGENVKPTDLAAATDAVSAKQLWQANLDALACFEERAATVTGPFPSVDGASVQYSVSAKAGMEEIDRLCTERLMPLAMRFALDESKTEAEALRAIRRDLEGCLVGAGVLAEAATGKSGATADSTLVQAAEADREGFQRCATIVG